jgi:hypothetical protein
MMITEDDLYAMGMESPTAWQKMQELCALAGVQFPPQKASQHLSNAGDNQE